MKQIVLFALALFFMSAVMTGCAQEPQTVLLGTTTSVQDSGLLEYLAPFILKDTGIKMDIVAQGSGQVLTNAANGDFDMVLTHSPDDEMKLIDSGKGIERKEFMYNFFVIAGPETDPAAVRSAYDASAAMKIVIDAGQKFVSRGDESGTNKKELKLFAAAGIDTLTLSADVYVSAGKGMGDTLNMTSEMQAYTLTDKSTFLSMKDKLNLTILLEKDEGLMNTYSAILVNPEIFPDINKEAARLLYDWLFSEKGLGLIAEYGKAQYGEQLFFTDKAAE
ncbi:MAG: ABC transporter substrate-binding protein [Eubacteriales bacterium]